MATPPREFSFKEASSDIDKVTYWEDEQKLQIRFKKGREYTYSPVSYELYYGMHLAPSVGKFVRENIIKNKDILAEHVNHK